MLRTASFKEIDLKKELKYLHASSAGQVEVAVVPRFNFVLINSAVEAGASPGCQQSLKPLFGISYALNFSTSKQRPVHRHPTWKAAGGC